MVKKFKIVIPARFKSSRLPGKPLKKILGKEMIIRVAEICKKVVNKEDIIIATDHTKIKKICEKNNFKTVMTSKNCKTGTDRVFQAVKNIKNSFFINVQGDEPLIDPLDIKKIINAKKKYNNHVICGYCDVNYNDAKNTNIPKIVINKFSDLIYISRALVPSQKNEKRIKDFKYFKQVCIYAFSLLELKKFYSMQGKSSVENLEDIEILRFFELKIPIKMVKVSNKSIAVDVSKDLIKVKKRLKENERY